MSNCCLLAERKIREATVKPKEATKEANKTAEQPDQKKENTQSTDKEQKSTTTESRNLDRKEFYVSLLFVSLCMSLSGLF